MGRVTGTGEEILIPVCWFSVQINYYLPVLDTARARYVQEVQHAQDGVGTGLSLEGEEKKGVMWFIANFMVGWIVFSSCKN